LIATRYLRIAGDGAPLLLLHGFGDSADTWRPLMAELETFGRPAVAPDLPGFGACAPLERAPLLPQWDAFVADVITQLARQSGRSVVVAGNSLGGLLTLRMAQRPDLPIAAAIPIAPGGLARPPWLRLLRDDVVVRRLLALPLPWPRHLIGKVMTQLYLQAGFHRPTVVDPRISSAFADNLRDKQALRRLVAVGRALAREGSSLDLNLADIEYPMLVVWGRQDRLLSPAGADLLADVVPNTRVVVLEQCGHCPQVEHPRPVAQAIEDFLGAVLPATARRRGSRRAPSPRRSAGGRRS